MLEIEWPNKYITLKTAMARDTLDGNQIQMTSGIAADHDSAGHRVIAAINGDYFDLARDGAPVSLHIQRGEIATNPTDRNYFALTLENRIHLGTLTFDGYIEAPNGRRYRLSGVNAGRGSDQLILYNRYRGNTTKTNAYGTEISLEPLEDWQLNSPVPAVVTGREIGKGNMQIPRDGVVLSGHHVASIFLNNQVENGDTILISLGFRKEIGGITEALGGGEMILQDGRVTASAGERHPRTCVAITQDTNKVLLFTVDGRSDVSAGMTLQEVGQFLKKQFGAHTALNLDGGGSTTMVIWDTIVNTPSDITGERPVANALLLVSSAPDSILEKYPEEP